jgi:hypothetical protein
VLEALKQECQGSFHSNDLFLHAQVLRQDGDSVCPEDHRRYLANVRLQVRKQQQELEECESSWGFKALLRDRIRMTSHIIISALLIICGLIFLAIIINLVITQGN